MTASTTTTDKVFVYGTLRKKEEATHFLEEFALYDAGPYPYIRPTAKGHSPGWDEFGEVYGNLLEVTDAQLADMDRYEGIERGLYTRERVTVKDMYTHEPQEVWVYVGGPDWPSRIPTGDWYNKEQ